MAAASSPSPHVARPTTAVLNSQWQGTNKEPEKKWNLTSALSSTLGLSPNPTSNPASSNYTSSNKKYQHVQSRLYSPTTASIHNQASPRAKNTSNDDDNMSVQSRFTTSSISPKAQSPTQDTAKWSKSVLRSVEPVSYQYRGSQNPSESFLSNGNIEDDSISVISRISSASKKYADVPSRLHQPTTASINSRATRAPTASASQSPRPTSSPTVKSTTLSSAREPASRPSLSPIGKSISTPSNRYVTSTIQSQHTSSPPIAAPVQVSTSTAESKFIDIVKIEDELSALNIAPSPKVGSSGLRMSKPVVPSFVSIDVPAPSAKSVVSDIGSAVGTHSVGVTDRRVTETSSQLLDVEAEDETY